MTTQIAILGWGSLLWDSRPNFDENHGPWQLAGPNLKVEFSRISESRSGALTLVVDSDNGSPCRVAYAISKRREPEDAICDLRSREGTVRKNIGIYYSDGTQGQSKNPATLAAVIPWAEKLGLDVVVWTDLATNFKEQTKLEFSVQNAIAHLQTLDAKAKVSAVEYVWRAPEFITTPLRATLEVQPWFKH